jgi:hypothetical protein
MACRGVLFALSPADEARILGCESDAALLELIQDDIEQRWEEDHLAETDKAWDAMHRCLSDGKLSFYEPTALGLCILGGKPLYKDTQTYVVSYKTKEQVKQAAKATKEVTRDWLRSRYFALSEEEYGFPLTDDDFEYTWEYFQPVRDFYTKAANDDRAAIFTVDQ